VNICVAGLWHLGTVTAACLPSAGHDVIGLDSDSGIVSRLSAGDAPLFEPGLNDLLRAGLTGGRLTITTDVAAAVGRADVVWITYDTPVNDDDEADVDFVIGRTKGLFPHLKDNALLVVSSQVPAGTTRQLEQAFAAEARGRHVEFAYSPENLRLGCAIEAFTHPDRIVVGVRSQAGREKASELLRPITDRIEWMSVESAEMTKHALNAFLATSITFINEVATLCERVGADASDVERGLKSETRIGPRAYLSPGGAFAGGTLARDVAFLSALGQSRGVATHLLSAIRTSNDTHRRWAQERLEQLLNGVSGKTIAVWGLTYKPGTDTLRRSNGIELCRWLVEHGATVRAHDPVVKALPPDLAGDVTLADGALSAVTAASALVVSTPWPDYRAVAAADIVRHMKRTLVLDANRFTADTLGSQPRIEYVSVGRSE
jgi:UDPglucose 6-dehydrogenase